MRLRHFAALFIAWSTLSQTGFAYEKATEGSEVVMDKLYPKKRSVELDLRLGYFLTSSYLNSFLANAALTYFWSENWGFSLEGNFVINSDKEERGCIETFYNDPNKVVTAPCSSKGGSLADDPQGDANYGPAYVPIRKLNYILTGNFVWNPIYGKQILLLSATNYFDMYLTFGGGVAMSDFYPERRTLLNDSTKSSRAGDFCVKAVAAKKGCDPSKNPGTTDISQTGTGARPIPQAETTPLIHLAIGQRFHFLKHFVLDASIEDYALIGTEQGFDNFLVLSGGVGYRF